MKWSTDKPTIASRWYWFKSLPPAQSVADLKQLLWVYETEDDDGRTLCANGSGGHGWVDQIEGMWAGPIPEPE